MTAAELFRYQCEEAGRMLSITFAGLPEDKADFKLGGMMSPREQVAHLIQCYMAALDIAAGKTPTWDSYETPQGELGELITRWRNMRQDAVSAYGDDEKSLKNANSYILGHDHYHIGQMCALRVAIEPSWDTYAIYES